MKQLSNNLDVVTDEADVSPSSSPLTYNFFVKDDILKGKDYLGVVHDFGAVTPPFKPFFFRPPTSFGIPGSFTNVTGTLTFPADAEGFLIGFFIEIAGINIPGPAATLIFRGIINSAVSMSPTDAVQILNFNDINGVLANKTFFVPMAALEKNATPVGVSSRVDDVTIDYTLDASTAVIRCDLTIAPVYMKELAVEFKP